MITAIYSFYSFGGLYILEPWVIFWMLSIIGYFAVFMLFKHNRKKQGVKNIVVGFLTAEIVFDVIWAVIYCVDDFYLEYLVGVTYGFFMWVALLVIAGIVSTIKTYKK